MLVFVACMLFMPSTMENEAICAIDSLVSIGADGSWCVSWATNSFRKPSLSIDPFGFETEPSAVPLVAAVWPVVAGVVVDVALIAVMKRG